MTAATRSTTVTTHFLALAEVAAEDPNGRIAIRTPTGMVSFYPVGDGLEARVSEAQADYFAKIEGYDVEGREPKPAAPAPIACWTKEGERLKKERDQTQVQAAPAGDPMAALVALLGGPDVVKALLTQALIAQAPVVAGAAQAELDERQAELDRQKQAREEAQGWTFFKLQGKVGKELAVELLGEFEPAFDAGGHHNGNLSRLAKIAGENHVLSDRLMELVG